MAPACLLVHAEADEWMEILLSVWSSCCAPEPIQGKVKHSVCSWWLGQGMVEGVERVLVSMETAVGVTLNAVVIHEDQPRLLS